MNRRLAAMGSFAVLVLDGLMTVVIALTGYATGPGIAMAGQQGAFQLGVPLIWHGLAPFVLAAVLLPTAAVLWRSDRQDLARAVVFGVIADAIAHATLTQIGLVGAFAASAVKMAL